MGRHCRHLLAFAALVALFPGGIARADGATCDVPAYQGPVSLLILRSAAQVHSFAATVRDANILRRDAQTVVFSDGRVVTADAEAAGQHLNELGWGARRIDLVQAFSSRARPRRRRG